MPSDPPAAGLRTCPFCEEKLDSIERICPHCDEDLSAELEADLSLAVERATREDAAEGRFDPGTASAFRRFRTKTIVCAAILALCLVLIVAGWGKSPSAPTVLAWIGAFVLVIPTLVAGIRDLLLKSPADLATPRAAYETYVKCLKEKRWGYALSLVVPRGREGEHRRPGFGEIRVEEESFAVDTPKGLASFWGPLLHAGPATSRSFRSGAIHVAETGPDTAVAGSVFTISVANLVTRSSVEIPLDMPLMKVEGRWYLVAAVPAIPAQ